MKVASYWTAALVMTIGVSACAQEITGMPTPLATLISEAQSNNTQLSAADHAWKAATHVAQQGIRPGQISHFLWTASS